MKLSTPPDHRRLQRGFFAACIVLGPLLMIAAVICNPSRSAAGSSVILAWMNTSTATRSTGIIVAVLELFLLPFGAVGMAAAAMRRSPWLATIGGFLSLSGVMAFAVFLGQEILSRQMADMGGGPQLATLWDHVNTDPLLNVCLYVFAVGHLFGPLLLAIGMGRTKLIPAWAAWAIIVRAPLQIAGFVSGIGLTIEIPAYALLALGSVPVALALIRLTSEQSPRSPSLSATPALRHVLAAE